MLFATEGEKLSAPFYFVWNSCVTLTQRRPRSGQT
jgi:hypothetical protein